MLRRGERQRDRERERERERERAGAVEREIQNSISDDESVEMTEALILRE
jgi:hypothetical protein